MERLTVLLDPGRLKRWVGPNATLGPPLKVGQRYTLQIGLGMTGTDGRPLLETFHQHFLVDDPMRDRISIESWRILAPAAGSRAALMLKFPRSLDWAMLFHTITIHSSDDAVIEGQIAVDHCEKRWSFTPASPWINGIYRIRVGSSLEDVCGNTTTSAFERPFRKDLDSPAEEAASLTFRVA
jgi:hypothetical protein